MKEKFHHQGRLVRVVVMIGLFLLWWGPVVEYAMADPTGYNTTHVFATFVLFSTPLHLVAWKRYSKMLKVTEHAEKVGLVDPGSALFARNQRFRYTIRALEALYLIVVAGMAAYAVGHPSFQTNKTYSKVVLTYIFGTIAATAYLTYRDLHVLQLLKRIDLKVSGITPDVIQPLIPNDPNAPTEKRRFKRGKSTT